MSAEFIAPVSAIALASTAVRADVVAAGASAASSFAALVGSGLAAADRQFAAGQVDLRRLAAGEATNLHQVMIGLEESRLALQLVVQVRTRLLESYQELMRMQV